MKDLIAKLEAATEGSRKLDEDIAIATGIVRAWESKYRYWNFQQGEQRWEWPEPIPLFSAETGKKIILPPTPWHGWSNAIGVDIPSYTTSIDAALTLVPRVPDRRYRVLLDSDPDRAPEWRCLVRRSGELGTSADGHYGTTAPLAICIASLRARLGGGE